MNNLAPYLKDAQSNPQMNYVDLDFMWSTIFAKGKFLRMCELWGTPRSENLQILKEGFDG